MTLFDTIHSTCRRAARAMGKAMDLTFGPAPPGFYAEGLAAARFRKGWEDPRSSETWRQWQHRVARQRYSTVAGREWQADQLRAAAERYAPDARRLREWQDAQTSEAADEDTQPDITPYKAEFECPACGAGLKLTASTPPLDCKPGDWIAEPAPSSWRWVGESAVYVPAARWNDWINRLDPAGAFERARNKPSPWDMYVSSLSPDDMDAKWAHETRSDKGHAPAAQRSQDGE